MYRQVQPAMQAGGGGARPWREEADVYEQAGDHSVLTRSWALTRLVVLVVACGLVAAAAIAIFIAAFVTALDSSL